MIGFSTTVAEAVFKIRVRIPNLTLDENLDKTHATLNQAAGHEATLAVGRRRRITKAVHILRFLILLRDIQRVGRGHLHARGQLVAGDARVEIWLPGPLGAMRLVQSAQQLALRLDKGRRQHLTGFQIEQRQPLGAESRTLAHWREPAGMPVLDAVNREPFRVVQHDVGRQVLVLTPKSVYHPRAQGRPARNGAPAVHQVQGGLVIEVLAEHGSDKRDIVRAGAQVRQQFGKLHAAFSAAHELERRWQHSADFVCKLDFT